MCLPLHKMGTMSDEVETQECVDTVACVMHEEGPTVQQTVPLAVGITLKEEDVLMRMMMMFLNPHLGEHSKQASEIRFRRLEKVDLELLNGMVIS